MVRVLILYATDPGTVSATPPTSFEACTDEGTADQVAMIPPVSDLKLTAADRRSSAMITPSLVCAVTAPDSEFSVIAPAPADTRTATARGTATV